MIEPKKFGTIAEAADAAGVQRRTLHEAVKRVDAELEIVESYGGTPWVSIKSVKKWAKVDRKRGRKPSGKS